MYLANSDQENFHFLNACNCADIPGYVCTYLYTYVHMHIHKYSIIIHMYAYMYGTAQLKLDTHY